MSTEWLDVSSTDPRISYAVGPAQTIFTVPFIFFANTDLDVYVDGVLQTINIHYTVAGALNPSGGTVTFLTAQTGVTVLIVRDVPIALSTHIPPSGPLDVPGINFQFSKIVAMIQQVKNQQLLGVISPPVSSTNNAIARWSGTGGGALRNSGVLIDDSNNVTGAASLALGTSPALTGLLKLANAGWIAGRNAAGNADLNMFRVNASNFTEFSNPIFYDTDGGFVNTSDLIKLVRNTASPGSLPSIGGVVYNVTSIHAGKGNNASFIGVSGGFFQARDRSDVTALNKGVLYGLQASCAPLVARNNVPFDDANCLVCQNDGTAKGTDCIYIGDNPGIAGSEWATCFQCDADADVFIGATGDYQYGIDFLHGAISTFTQSAIRIPNATKISARNAANGADIEMLQLNSGNAVRVGCGSSVLMPGSITTGEGVSTGDATLELGGNRTGSGNAYIDLHATSGSDYELRLLRLSGANGASSLQHAGTGNFTIVCDGVAPMIFSTSNAERLRIESGGTLKFAAPSFAANGGGAVTVTALRPGGAATATITRWLTFNDEAGVDSYIPVWQ